MKSQDPHPEHLQSIINLFSNGRLQQALSESSKMLEKFPNSINLYNIAGVSNAGLMQFDAAIDCYRKALKIKPDYFQAYNNMGNVLKDKDDQEAAIDCYRKAIKIKPDYFQAYNNMGNVLKDINNPEAAIDCYRKALKMKPDYANCYKNMGIALQDKDDPEAAIDCYRKAIKIKPDYAEVYRLLSTLNSYKKHDEHFIKMQGLCLDPDISDEQHCHLNFALSKASEDLNEIDQSFNYLKMGNELRKKILSYDVKQDIEMFSQIKKSYPNIALQSEVKESKINPIFILGMPRSGTTLVEQVVSSHSEVTGAGELNYVQRYGPPIARGQVRPNIERVSEFRQSYIELLNKRSDGKSFVTDKMPQNFLYIGLIFSAFPYAKVIHVNRDPAATCWSNYKNYFATKGLGYSYSLADIVTYFGLYKNLMQFWWGHYGDRIYNLNYDNLTIDQDDETRKLINYLGLKWEDGCLSPQHNKRAVRTASQQQVRQKIYQGSSQLWRKFEPYLNGKFDQLS